MLLYELSTATEPRSGTQFLLERVRSPEAFDGPAPLWTELLSTKPGGWVHSSDGSIWRIKGPSASSGERRPPPRMRAGDYLRSGGKLAMYHPRDGVTTMTWEQDADGMYVGSFQGKPIVRVPTLSELERALGGHSLQGPRRNLGGCSKPSGLNRRREDQKREANGTFVGNELFFFSEIDGPHHAGMARWLLTNGVPSGTPLCRPPIGGSVFHRCGVCAKTTPLVKTFRWHERQAIGGGDKGDGRDER